MSLHQTSEYMKSFKSTWLPFEKEMQEIWEPILSPFEDPQHENNKNLFIGEDLSWEVFILAAVPEADSRILLVAFRSSKKAS